MTSEMEALCLAPGWLHVTYALESGVVIRNTWCSAESLEITTEITIREPDTGTLSSIDGLRKTSYSTQHESTIKLDGILPTQG